MDFQTLLIGLAVFIISALLIWLITSLMVRERSFEERFEQQRQIERELTSLDSKKGPNGASSKKSKINKKQTKKTKTSGIQDGSPLTSTVKPESKNLISKDEKTLELEIDPQVFETALDEPPAVIGKQKSSKPKTNQVKPILMNKNEKIAVRKIEETPELFHYRSVPKDDLELKHDKDKLKLSAHPLADTDASDALSGPDHPIVKSVPEKQKEVVDVTRVVGPSSGEITNGSSTVNGFKTKKQRQKEPETLIEEVMVKSQADHVGIAAPVTSGQDQPLKKKTKDKDIGVVNGIPSHVNIKDLIESIQKATLSDDDARRLIDVVNAKSTSVIDNGFAAPGSEWSKKNQKEALVALTRQLEEKKREAEEEKLRAAAASQKVIQQEKELEDLRMKLATLAKQNNDQLTSQRQDNAALGGRIKQQEAAVVTMKNQMETMKAQLTTTLNELQRVNTENLHLVAKSQQVAATEGLVEEMRQKVKIMDDALNSNAMTYNTCENAKKNLESKVKHLEDQVAFLESSLRDSQMVAKHYSEAPEELRKAELHIKGLNLELEHQTSAFQHIEKELALRQEELKLNENKLHDIRRQKSELEGRLRLADSQVGELANTLKCRDTEIQALTAQLNEVLADLKIVKETPVTADSHTSEEFISKSEAQNLTTVPQANVVLDSGEDTSTKLLIDELREKNSKIESLLSEKQSEVADAHLKLHQKEQEFADIQSQLNHKSVEFDLLQQKVESSETNQIELREKHSKIESLLSEKQSELAEAHLKLHQKEHEFADIQSQLNHKSVEFDLLRQKVESSETNQTELSQKDVTLADLASRLQLKESEYKGLKERLQSLEVEHANLQNDLREKEAEVSAKDSSLNQRDQEYSNASQRLLVKDSEVTTLEAKIVNLEFLIQQKDAATSELQLRLSKSEEELSTVEAQIKQKVSEIAAVSSNAGESAAQIQLLVDQLAAITGERNELSSLVLILQDEIEMLRKSALDESSNKDNLDQQVEQVRDLQTNLNRLQQENKNLTEAVQRLQGAAAEAENAAEFNSTRQRNETENLHVALSSSRESENRLLKQIQHYKEVLSDTESILKKLQDTVETEERKNLEKVQSLEMQLESAKDELQTVLRDRNEITKTLEKRLQDTVETEERKNLEKVQSLEMQLESAKDELQTVLKDRNEITRTLEESALKRLQETVESEEIQNLENVLSLEMHLESAKDEFQTVLKDQKEITRTQEGFPNAEAIAVDHAECMLRKDSSLGRKGHSLTELSGEES